MKGLTLIEMVIVIALLGATAAIFTVVLTEGNVAFLFLSRENQIIQESRVAMNWMTQELTSELLLGTSHSFTEAPSATSLKFTRNSDSQTVIYSCTGCNLGYVGTLSRQLGAESARALAGNVSSFILDYLDASEGSLGSTDWDIGPPPTPLPMASADLPNIATIVINMTIQVGDKAITLKSAVSPRNTGP